MQQAGYFAGLLRDFDVQMTAADECGVKAAERRKRMAAFIIWALVGCLFIGFGISAFMGKKPAGFWANAKMFEVTDVRKYNHAMGKLWVVAGLAFILLGLPLLDGQNSAVIFLTVIGCLVWVIAVMIVYELIIRRKYQKK